MSPVFLSFSKIITLPVKNRVSLVYIITALAYYYKYCKFSIFRARVAKLQYLRHVGNLYNIYRYLWHNDSNLRFARMHIKLHAFSIAFWSSRVIMNTIIHCSNVFTVAMTVDTTTPGASSDGFAWAVRRTNATDRFAHAEWKIYEPRLELCVIIIHNRTLRTLPIPGEDPYRLWFSIFFQTCSHDNVLIKSI